MFRLNIDIFAPKKFRNEYIRGKKRSLFFLLFIPILAYKLKMVLAYEFSVLLVIINDVPVDQTFILYSSSRQKNFNYSFEFITIMEKNTNKTMNKNHISMLRYFKATDNRK